MMTEEDTHNNKVDNETEPEIGGSEQLNGEVIITNLEMMETQANDKTANEKMNESTVGDGVMYKVDDVPPWYLCILLGLQHYLTMLGGTITLPFIICPALCIEEDDPARGYIISTIFFMSGIVTFLQSTFGVRLPIVQGGTFAFLAPTFAILSLDRNKCPADFEQNGWGSNYTQDMKTEEWQRRMREVQGAIMVASCVQVVLGFFGIIGAILRWITPLTIAPAVCLIGLSLFPVASDFASDNWAISMTTVFVLILLSQYLKNIDIPCLAFNKSRGVHRAPFALFKLFPVLLSIALMWILCAILTATDVLEPDNAARTDLQTSLLQNSDWIRFPYPFQWGLPIVTAAGVLGMVAGVLTSAIESIGDYYACARLAGAPPPPTHAINRGIGIEGIGCILTGMWGTGTGTTSYSENIGAIGVTKVGSRRVIQYGALIMVILGLLCKFGALFVTLPTPIVGGMFMVMFSLIAAVGLSNLQFVDLNSSRNMFVLGFPIFFGLMLPAWVAQNEDAINTGVDTLDQIIIVLLETSMFVGGFLGFLLDNTIPGSPEERGLIKWQAQLESHSLGKGISTYDLPFISSLLQRSSWTRYVPFLPQYDESAISCKPVKNIENSVNI